MHVFVAWEHFEEPIEAERVDSYMLDLFVDNDYAKALNRLYIVKVEDDVAAKALQAKLIDKVRSARESWPTLNIVISSAIPGGRYNGFIPRSRWKSINEKAAP